MKLTAIKVWIARDEDTEGYYVYGSEPVWNTNMQEFFLNEEEQSSAVAKLCAEEFESLTGMSLEPREVIQATLEINPATLTKVER